MIKIIVTIALAFFGVAASTEGSLNEADVVMLGDSITWLGNDDCNGEKGWTSYWKTMIEPKSCRSYARSGATWSNTSATRKNTQENVGRISNDNTVYNQVMRLKEAIASGQQPQPELIMIAAGTNDLWFPKSRPDALTGSVEKAWSESAADVLAKGPSAATSIAQSVRLVMAELAETCPAAKVIILTPLQCTKINGEKMEAGSRLIEESARKAGAMVIRQDRETPLDSISERRQLNLTYDGVHTSKAGAKAIGEALARRTIELLGQ
ncbi:MAG: SGNH/GDSL hydrolase family protein [Paramuribaculum sp.]|nr:SGNH/GDSL hydrolase family protein [Paramuribaculum sp.]